MNKKSELSNEELTRSVLKLLEEINRLCVIILGLKKRIEQLESCNN